MAEGDGVIYNTFKELVMEGIYDLSTGGDTLQVALVTGYTPNIDTHVDWADVSANEETGTGYTADGITLTSQDVTMDTGNDRGVFDAADVTWTGLDVGTPSHAILWDDTPTSPVDPLIAYWEITTASNGGNYSLQWNAVGLITLT